MNTKNILNKIAFRKFEEMSSCEFYHTALENGLFSNLNFLETFKDNGPFFWEDVILNTSISFEVLFLYFEKQLLNNETIKQFKFSYDLYCNMRKNLYTKDDIKIKIKKLKGFLDEYEKHIK